MVDARTARPIAARRRREPFLRRERQRVAAPSSTSTTPGKTAEDRPEVVTGQAIHEDVADAVGDAADERQGAAEGREPAASKLGIRFAVAIRSATTASGTIPLTM